MRTTACVLIVTVMTRGLAGAGEPPGSPEAPVRAAAHDECAVPNVVGLDQAAALAALDRARLRQGQHATRHAESPAGMVIDQRPAACGDRPADGRIDLVVSEGPYTPGVPGTRERGRGSAIADLAVPLGIGVGVAVLGHVLSRRDRPVAVPDLVRQQVGDAETRLARAQLQLGEIVNVGAQEVPAGAVIEHDPVAGTRVARGSTVNLRVSSGLPMVVVPDVAGKPWPEAESFIVSAGLRPVTMDRPDGAVDGLLVRAQIPEAGTHVVRGAAVGVTLAQPPRASAAPAVSESQVDAASQAPPRTPSRPAQTAGAPATTGTPTPPVAVPPDTAPADQAPAEEPAVRVVQPPPSTTVLMPSPPLVPRTGPPAAVVTVVPSWRWPWFLLVLLAMVALWTRGHAPRAARATPPTPLQARMTFVPRLDAGSQSMSRARGRTLEFALRLDAGTQTLETGEDPTDSEGALS